MSRKILLTDDDQNVVKLLSIGLKKAGYTVITAENGLDAFELAQKEHPDLIVSDVVMPEMDGIALCKKIREESDISLVPFIFMSSLDDPSNEIRGFRAGADEYLVKPVDRNVLLEKVGQLLERQEKNSTIAQEVSREKTAFSGNLENLSMGEIIQLLNLNRRDGKLVVTDTQNESGRIEMENGQMLFAEYKKSKGEEAVYAMVKLQKGSFEFVPGKYSGERNIQGATMNILMEGLRLMDEETLD